jgi:hypothetical protein
VSKRLMHAALAPGALLLLLLGAAANPAPERASGKGFSVPVLPEFVLATAAEATQRLASDPGKRVYKRLNLQRIADAGGVILLGRELVESPPAVQEMMKRFAGMYGTGIPPALRRLILVYPQAPLPGGRPWLEQCKTYADATTRAMHSEPTQAVELPYPGGSSCHFIVMLDGLWMNNVYVKLGEQVFTGIQYGDGMAQALQTTMQGLAPAR